MDSRHAERLHANQQALMAEVARVRGVIEGRVPADTEALPAPALDRLCAVFGLSPFERDLLLMCAGAELDGAFADAVGRPSFALALSTLREAHWAAVSPASPLRYWRLVEPHPGALVLQAALRIDERILHYLLGIQELDERIARLAMPVKAEAPLPASHDGIAAQIGQVWRPVDDAAKLPVVQLLGASCADTRSVAAAACARLGLRLFRLAASDLPTPVADTASVLRLWEREAALFRAALLLEVEESDHAPVARKLVDRARCAVLVSSREPLGEISRATVALQVGKPTAAEQRALWQDTLGAHAMCLNGALDAMTAQFDLHARTIRTIAQRRAAEAATSPGTDPSEIPSLMWDAARAASRGQLDDLAHRIEPSATWNDIVLPEAQRRLLREMAAQVRHRTMVYETWGLATTSRRGLGISALFAGASGTGKTMAAEVLANELRLDLYRIDLSQVVSKYIGETEKNLRRVFDTAEQGGAILLFDEADALFGKRSDVKDSHDRYANIEVSYLLQRMEAYRGLTILTSNMKHALDPAFLRRIRFIVHFPFPDAAQRAEIWRQMFPSPTPTSGLQFDRLSRLAMPGGHIRNIAVNAAFLAADAHEAVQMKHVLHATRSEYAKLEKPLSEAEIGGWVVEA